jgi:zinc protease
VSTTPTDGLQREQLPNGVTLLFQRRQAAPAATLVTMVRAGFLDEPDTLVGVSHVLEHMLFKGTPTVGPGELAQRTKALGGALNAYTSYDRTVYYASVPARHAVELIALQADQVRNPLIDADELRRELGVIIQEARRKLDAPGAVAAETLHELLFDTHRLRRWRIGVEQELEQFTRDDVAGYHASRYLPSRTIVSLVADLEPSEALDALREEWGGWRGPAADIPPGPVETSAASVRTRVLHGDVAMAEVALGWRGPGILEDDVPALDVAAAILALGRGSRFARRLRDPGIVAAVGASHYGVVDTGVFSIGAELDPGRLPALLDVVGASVAELAAEPPAQAEFDRALTMLRARVRRRLERYESRAIALADAELHGDVSRLDREEADFLAVTPERVREVAERWLIPGGISGVAYLPRDSQAVFDAATLGAAMAVDASRQEPAVTSPVSPLSSLSPSVPVSPRSSLVSRPSSLLSVHHLPLGTLDILTARFGETGQTSVSVYRQRLGFETLEDAGLAALGVRSMMRGTLEHDTAALAFAMESLGGSLSPSLGADLLGFGATVLSEALPAAARLLAGVLYRPRFDAASVLIERDLLLDDARAVADDMVRFPIQLALGVAFDDRGYGAPALGTPDSLATFDAEVVRRWHAAMLGGGRTTIVAVGDRDPVEVADQLARAFAQVVTGDASVEGVVPVLHAGARVEHRDRKQSALAMLFPGPSRRDPDRYAAETWSAIAAGLGGRMFESLRSQRSLAYTVIANSWQRDRAGGLLTYIATDPVRLDEARAAMLEELAAFRTAPPSDTEMARATAMLAGQAEMSRQTAGGVAGEIADAWLFGGGLAELDDPAAPYRAVTAEAVHRVVAASLDPARRAEGIVAALATG